MRKFQLLPYNPEYPKLFEEYSKELKEALTTNIKQIYHIGSSSVPGLVSKPTIDIICVVKDLKTVKEPILKLGYITKGELNIPLRIYFERNDNVHVHVMLETCGEIKWNLMFRDYLREHEDAREKYNSVKLELVKNNPNGFKRIKNSISEYTLKKGEIVCEILKKAGFDGYKFVIGLNEYEIGECEKLLGKIELKENNYRLCLYKGMDINGAAYVEVNDNNLVIIKINGKNKDDIKFLQERIKEWADYHDWNLKIEKK